MPTESCSVQLSHRYACTHTHYSRKQWVQKSTVVWRQQMWGMAHSDIFLHGHCNDILLAAKIYSVIKEKREPLSHFPTAISRKNILLAWVDYEHWCKMCQNKGSLSATGPHQMEKMHSTQDLNGQQSFGQSKDKFERILQRQFSYPIVLNAFKQAVFTLWCHSSSRPKGKSFPVLMHDHT